MFLVAIVLAATPIPTKILTIKVTNGSKGSIVIGTSVPSGRKLFEDEKEVLASITTKNSYSFLLFIKMTTVSSTN